MHPYATYYDGRHVIIKAEFEGETYLGKPHGLGLLYYRDSASEWNSFRGAGVMKEGKLHGGPAWFVRGNGEGCSFSYMQNGRPCGFSKYFNSSECTGNQVSLSFASDTSGLPYYLGDIELGWFKGRGKYFFRDGRVFNGDFDKHRMCQGDMSYLNSDSSRTVYSETFDTNDDFKRCIKITMQ